MKHPPDLSLLDNQQLLEYMKKVEYAVSKNKTVQQARKEQLNSAYGSFGNNYFRYFDVRLAEGVTKTGQFIIRFLMKSVNDFLNTTLKTNNEDYVIAVDTDSLVITLEKLMDKLFPGEKQKDTQFVIDRMDKFCEEVLQKVIDKSCEEIYDYLNAMDNTLQMKREMLADRALWLTKKRYVMSIIDSEHVRKAEPEYKIMGIEAIRSSTPELCRQKIKDCIKIVLTGTQDDLHKFVEEFFEEFKNSKVESIAFPRSVSGLEKYSSNSSIYIKGTPVQVRASLLHNFHIKKNNLEKKYDFIKEGEKMKFIYLKEPNFINENVIGFLHVLPAELNLDQSIDYTKQFEKAFIIPMKKILDCVKWTHEKMNTIDDCFLD